MRRWVCLTCTAQYDSSSRPDYCPNCYAECWQELPVAVGGRPVTFRERRRPRTRTLAELEEELRPQPKVAWGYDALVAPLKAHLCFEGAPGTMKSTAATAAALWLAQRQHRVGYLSVEEGQEETAVRRFARVRRSMGIARPSDLLQVADVRTVVEADDEIEDLIAWGAEVIVVDSYSELDARPDWLADLLARDIGVLLLQHVVTSGTPRGGLGPAFAVQVRVAFSKQGGAFRADVLKNRYGPCESFDPEADRLCVKLDEPDKLISLKGAR